MKLFAQIQKVDEEKRLVYGRAADETPDKSGEMLNYDGSKPNFQKWSADISADTGGKSLGNVRAMHGKVAVGKLTDISFDDNARTIDVCAKVVDDNEWKKVLEGVYTGFSIGGFYGAKSVEKVDGKELTRYIAIPNEISLVDRPCIPTAKFFEVQKADGTLAKVEFKEPVDDAFAEKRAEMRKVLEIDDSVEVDDETLIKMHTELMAEKDPVVEVTGTQDEIIAFGKLMNESGLTMAKVIDMVTAATVKKADTCPDGCDPEKWAAMSDEEKAAYKAPSDDDDEAAKVDAAAGAALTKMEEGLAELQKIGARNNASDKSRIEAIHKAAVELGATCGAAKTDAKGDLNKVDTATLEKLVSDAVAPLQKALDDAQVEITKLKAQPMPTTVSIRAVTKAADTDEPVITDPTEKDLVKDDHGAVHPAASLIKQTLAQGGQPLVYRG